jgi:hypothetical protein
MRKKVLLFVLVSLMMPMFISTSAQEADSAFLKLYNSVKFDGNDFTSVEDMIHKLPGAEIDADGNITVNGKPISKILVNGEPYFKTVTKEVYPKDMGIVTNDSYRAKMLEYAPQGFVCGYMMRNSWNKNLWGIFLVKEGRKYSIVYKEADKTETRSIKADLAKELEASVNKKIADTEKAVTTPTTVTVIEGIPEAVMVYEGSYAFAVTPDKAVYSWASNMREYKGINDEIWQKEKDLFAEAN